jgi:hypothetical protein
MATQDNLQPGQFRMEQRIKSKPNAQGTLFSADPSLRRPESRQPRGYSPERYAAVGRMIGHLYGGEVVAPPGTHEAQAHVLATVARSTVPLEDLKARHSSKGLSIGVSTSKSNSGGVSEGSAGTYHETKGPGHPATAWVTPEAAPTYAVLHEIGHHAEREGLGIPSTADPEKMGRSEGFADQYAETHYRTPGYKQRGFTVPSHSEDWHENYAIAPRDRYKFDNGYLQARRPPLQWDQFTARKESLAKGIASGDLPREHVSGQLPLLHKHTGSWGVGKTSRWSIATENL